MQGPPPQLIPPFLVEHVVPDAQKPIASKKDSSDIPATGPSGVAPGFLAPRARRNSFSGVKKSIKKAKSKK
jgi:hypothetical protein